MSNARIQAVGASILCEPGCRGVRIVDAQDPHGVSDVAPPLVGSTFLGDLSRASRLLILALPVVLSIGRRVDINGSGQFNVRLLSQTNRRKVRRETRNPKWK